MFELSAANLSLFEIEPIVSFVKYPCLVVNFWVRELPFAADSSEFAGLQAEALIDGNCHVVHNNSFTSPGGKTDGKGGWHQDDRPHVTTTDGKPLPSTTRLAVQLFTANYVSFPRCRHRASLCPCRRSSTTVPLTCFSRSIRS